MPISRDGIPVQLIERACEIAVQNSTGTLSTQLVSKIRDAAQDTTLGKERAFREPLLTANELQSLFAFFGSEANRFGALGARSENVDACVEAAANVSLSLLRVGLEPKRS